jgi:hypothetical protein
MQGRGVPKEALAMLDMVSFPLQLAAQVALAHATAGPRPLTRLVLGAFPLRALFGPIWLAVVYLMLPDRTKDPWTPDSVPWWVLGLIFVVSNAHGVVQTAMFMGQMVRAARRCLAPVQLWPQLRERARARSTAPLNTSVPHTLGCFARALPPIARRLSSTRYRATRRASAAPT